MAEFFAMGGYAAYIWPAYGLATVVLVALTVTSLRGLAERQATLKALESARPSRRRARRGAGTAADATRTPLETAEG